MKEYSFEQIISERIREWKKLDLMADAFNNLVTYNTDKYKFSHAAAFIDHNWLALYHDYANGVKRRMSVFMQGLPWTRYSSNGIIIKDMDDIQEEYFDDKGDTIFTIDDIELFKEKLDCLLNSRLFKELSSHRGDAKYVDSIDKKTKLTFYNYYTLFLQDKAEFSLLDDFFVKIKGDRFDAPAILEEFKASRFDSANFSDYFNVNVRYNTGKELKIVFDKNYNAIPYGVNKDGVCVREEFLVKENFDKKRLILTRKK